MPNNPLQVEILNLSGQNVTAIDNILYINGVNILSILSGANPSTSLLSVPISINVYGSQTALLGGPIGFIDVPVSGINRKIAFY